MQYFNQFHKESTERTLKSIEEMKKTPANYEKELQRHKEMQEQERLREQKAKEQ